MGLMDILNGMQNGPRGQSDPKAEGGMSPITMAILALLAYKAYQHASGGNAPGPAPAPAPAPGRLPDQSTADSGGSLGGMAGLDDLLKGGLGGLLGGNAGRSSSSGGGLDDLLKGGLGGLLGGLTNSGGTSRGGSRAAAPSGGGMDDLLKGGLGGLLAGGAAGSILSGGLGDLLKQFQDNGAGDVADSWVGTGANKQISTGDLARSLGSDDIDALSSRFGISREDMLSGLQQQLPDFIDQLTPDGRLPTEEEASRWV